MAEEIHSKIPQELLMIAENHLRDVGITPTRDAARAYLLGVFSCAPWSSSANAAQEDSD